MLLLKPQPILAMAISGVGASGLANLLTPSPKEALVATGVGVLGITVDLGAEVEADCFFLGFTNAHADALWGVATRPTIAGAATPFGASQLIKRPESIGPRHHGLIVSAPQTSRFFYFETVQSGAAPLEIGAIMLGKGLVIPHEFGGGRSIVDTGAKEALADGGFGLGAGAIKASLRWSFTDLDEATLAQLWALARDRGERRPILAVEDAADTVGRDERIHYGLFDRFETYERQNPDQTRWSMSMTEWV